MGQSTNLGLWKDLLAKLDHPDKADQVHVYRELASLFEHLPQQAVPRLQRQFETCTLETEELLGNLFDKVDLSDRQLTSAFLQMLTSFGYFRMSQIIYHFDGPRDDLDPDPVYVPNLKKSKWYDMCPLLPEAGTLGWKGLMNSGLVNEEKELLQACLQLLFLKLHFCSVILYSDRFQDSFDLIKRNGHKVAEKLLELMKDVAYSENRMLGLDSTLFNLLVPFLDENQLDEVIDAILQDLFKPFTLQKPAQEQKNAELYELIRVHIMNKSRLQDVMFMKLLEHLKTNIIRRKRRHSVEAAAEDGGITLESLLADIYNGEKVLETLSKVERIELSAKTLQTGFISYWVQVIQTIIPQNSLTSDTSLKLLGTCSVIIVTTADIIDSNLIGELSSLMSKIIETTALLNRLFNPLDPLFLIEFTKVISVKTRLLSNYDSPLKLFYRSHLNGYLKQCVVRNAKPEIEKFTQFVNFICDKNLDKTESHLLQCICVHAIANLLESFKNRIGNKILEALLDSARTCGRRLHKFIVRNSPLKDELNNQNHRETGSDLEEESDTKRVNVMSALVSILRIAIVRQDQEILDSYSELLLKLYSLITGRISQFLDATRYGTSGSKNLLDVHLSNLLNLYTNHTALIKGYLNYDLIEKISSMLLSTECCQVNGKDPEKGCKKVVYDQIKSKLEVLAERAKSSAEVYHTVINKQYSASVDPSIGSIYDIKKEKSCFRSYQHQLRILKNVLVVISSSCDVETYGKILKNTVQQLQLCDPFDHPKVLYLLLLIESLVPNCEFNDMAEAGTKPDLFKGALPIISCSLSNISKSVELGPSIHAFTRSGSHKSNRAIQCCTYASCIKIYTLILSRYHPSVNNSFVTDAMQICVSSNLLQYSKHSGRLYKLFIQSASAISELLKSIGISRKNEPRLNSTLPIFLTVFSNLIRCLIMAADCRSEIQLELIATDVARILNDLSFLRVKFVDYAPHLISTYIKDIQRASCPDYVKSRINEGIFRIFNLVDAHQQERQEEVVEAGIQRKTKAGRAGRSLFEMIHARLDQASREIFRDMHADYNRFHRYQGKI